MDIPWNMYWVTVDTRRGEVFSGLLIDIKNWRVRLATPCFNEGEPKMYVYTLIPISVVRAVQFGRVKIASE